MSDLNRSDVNTTNLTEGGPLGRFHQSGAHPLTDQGLELLSMPTLASRRLGIERLKEARAANDRLATCVLGMCAVEGVGYEPDEAAGVGLLEEASDMGSRMAEDYLARHLLSRWSGPELVEVGDLTGKARKAAERENDDRVASHRVATRKAWRYLRGPILRRAVTEADFPAVRAVYDEIVWRGLVTDPIELDCYMVLGSLGDAQATYLAALAYERGDGGALCYEVATRLMYRAMRMGHHDAIMWVRFARRAGRVA